MIMSFGKYMGKEHRKPYRGSKNYDRTCRNHGGCPACLSNRTIANTRRQQAADNQLKEQRTGDDSYGGSRF